MKIIKRYKYNKHRGIASNILQIGLKRLNYLLDYYSNDTSFLNFICGPEFSISLNQERMKSGFCIGGILTWEDNNEPIFPIEVMPNSCGMALIKLNKCPNANTILDKIKTLKKAIIEIDGLKLELDIANKNHFLNIYKNVENDDIYAILHCSLPETKKDNPIGMGTYYTHSEKLSKILEVLETPFGHIRYLHGENAKSFKTTLKKYDIVSKQKKIKLLEYIFGEFEIIANENHLSFPKENMMLLGCNSPNNINTLIPLTIAPMQNAYIVESKQKVRIGNKSISVIPHGSGIKLMDFDNIRYDEEKETFIASGENKSIYFNSLVPVTQGYFKLKEIGYRNLFSIRIILEPIMEFKL